jgi:hypothetical protein
MKIHRFQGFGLAALVFAGLTWLLPNADGTRHVSFLVAAILCAVAAALLWWQHHLEQ